MSVEMLQATREAAWAAQSAAQAAWWGLLANGAVVAVAIGTTFFQEWRVARRTAAASSALHQGAVDTVRQGWIAMDEARDLFRAAGRVDVDAAGKTLAKILRARRLIALFVAREVDPKILIGLLQMDDHLAEAEKILSEAIFKNDYLINENAAFNGLLDQPAFAAEMIYHSLA